MKNQTNAVPAFHGSTVVSTRKDGAIEGAIVRRRQAADGSRFTTYEIDEGMAEKLLDMPGGLKRRNTAINPDNVTEAVRLHTAGTDRKAAEAALGVSSGTYRRLLLAGGVDTRRYTAVLTDENVEKALKATVKYNITKRGDIIKASKEVGVDSRTLRRLIQKGISTLTTDRIGEIRSLEQQRLATDAGQLELELSKRPIPRKPKPAAVPLADTGTPVEALAPATAVVPAGDVPVMDSAPVADPVPVVADAATPVEAPVPAPADTAVDAPAVAPVSPDTQAG